MSARFATVAIAVLAACGTRPPAGSLQSKTVKAFVYAGTPIQNATVTATLLNGVLGDHLASSPTQVGSGTIDETGYVHEEPLSSRGAE